MRSRVKYAVIYRHRKEYPVVVMCKFFSVSRSGYYSYVKRMNQPEKDGALAETIRQQQAKCFHTYGYRRMWQWLKASEGIYRNPKTILRVMQKYGLLAEIRRHKKWKQMGQQVYIAIFKIKAYSRMNGTNLHSPVELQPEMHAESHLEEHPMSLL